jgi:hypothetical protein
MDGSKQSAAFRSAATEVVMPVRNKISLIILGIVAQLLFFGEARAGELQTGGNTSEQEIVIPPEQHDMTLVASQPWVVEGEVLGRLAAYVYSDVATKRPVDYLEIYDKEGDLMAVSWFDRFGIQRTAVDRGIVEEEDKLEGIFVVVLDGNSI